MQMNFHFGSLKKENLKKLSKIVVEKGADIGVAFDGDGDRLGVVDDRGNVVEPDRVMVALGRNLLENGGGDVVVNVESSMIIETGTRACGLSTRTPSSWRGRSPGTWAGTSAAT